MSETDSLLGGRSAQSRPLSSLAFQTRPDFLPSVSSLVAGRISIAYIFIGLYAALLFVDIGNFLALEFGPNEPFRSATWWFNELSIGRILLLWILSRAVLYTDLAGENGSTETALASFLTFILGIIDLIRGINFVLISGECSSPVCYLEAGTDLTNTTSNDELDTENLPATTQFLIALWTSFISAVFELLIFVYVLSFLPDIQNKKEELAQREKDIVAQGVRREGRYDLRSTTQQSLNNVRASNKYIVDPTPGGIGAELRGLFRWEAVETWFWFVTVIVYIFFFGNFIGLEFETDEPYQTFIPWFLIYIHGVKLLAVFLSFVIARIIRRSTRVTVVQLFAAFLFVIAVADLGTVIMYALEIFGDCDQRYCHGTAGNGQSAIIAGSMITFVPTRFAWGVFIACIVTTIFEIILGGLYIYISNIERRVNSLQVISAGMSIQSSYPTSIREQTSVINQSNNIVGIEADIPGELDSVSESGEYLNYLPPQKLAGLPGKSRKRRLAKEVPFKASVVTEERRKGLYEGAKFD